MQKVCRWRFLSFFGTAHVIQKLKIFFLWKFHWVWREVVGMRRNIKKMTDICKIVLGSGQCQKCVDVGSWVSLALLMSLGISKVFFVCKFHFTWRYFGGMSQIINKMTDFWNIVLGSPQCQKCVDPGSWVSLALVTWLRNYNFFFFFFFKFHWVWLDIRGMLRIIKNMPDFWKIILGSTEFFLEVSLSLTWCWRKVLNYQKNNGFLENCFKL